MDFDPEQFADLEWRERGLCEEEEELNSSSTGYFD
jgi:hypothetical protein